MELPSCSDLPIWDIWLQQWSFPSLTVALELGVFEALRESPAGLCNEELAQKLKVNVRGTAALTRVLLALKVLQLDGTDSRRLKTTPLSDTYCMKGGGFYWGNMLLTDKNNDAHAALKGAIEKDVIIGAAPSWEKGELSVEKARSLTSAFHSHSLATAIGFADAVDITGLFGVKHVMDVGGGSGCFSIAMAKKHPALQCTVMDLPAVTECVTTYVPAELSGRVSTVPKDMFHETWPSDMHDAVFLSNILHDWSDDQNDHILKSAFDSLPSGGHVLVNEMLLSDDDTRGSLAAALFTVHMLVYTRGKQFVYDEIAASLQKAGFVGVSRTPSAGYYTLVSARKP